MQRENRGSAAYRRQSAGLRTVRFNRFDEKTSANSMLSNLSNLNSKVRVTGEIRYTDQSVLAAYAQPDPCIVLRTPNRKSPFRAAIFDSVEK